MSGFKHYHNFCADRRVVTLREAVAIWDELFEEESILEYTFVSEEVCE